MFTEYFSIIPLLSFHHQLHRLHDLLHVNLVPYIPPRSLYVKLLSMPVCKQPDVADVTGQDFLTNLRDTRLVGNSACYPGPRLTITFCFPTCIIPTEINLYVICENIDVVNKSLPYVIKNLAWVVTVLFFLCCCVVVAYIFNSFYLEPAPIFHTLCNVIIISSTHLSVAINFSTVSTPYTIPYNASIMENNFRKHL